MFDILAATINGLYRLGASFVVMLLGNLRFVPSSQTLVPTSNGVNHGCSLIQDSCALCWAS